MNREQIVEILYTLYETLNDIDNQLDDVFISAEKRASLDAERKDVDESIDYYQELLEERDEMPTIKEEEQEPTICGFRCDGMCPICGGTTGMFDMSDEV